MHDLMHENEEENNKGHDRDSPGLERERERERERPAENKHTSHTLKHLKDEFPRVNSQRKRVGHLHCFACC